MKRRLMLGLMGLAPLSLLALKTPNTDNPLISILIKRWKSARAYTLAVLDTMPAERLEYAPSEAQMSFAQHFMHLGLINNFYMGILIDSKTYPDFNALIKANFLIERPDPINLFQPDRLQPGRPAALKEMVAEYVGATFDYVIATLGQINDQILPNGEQKEKPAFLSGHTNLDLIIRGEQHTAHHRAQAIGYLRSIGIQPPGYTVNNKF